MHHAMAAVVQSELPDCFLLQGGVAGEVCAAEGAPFPLFTMPFAEGDEEADTASPAPAGGSLGVGMLAAVLLGCLSGVTAPACAKIQA